MTLVRTGDLRSCLRAGTDLQHRELDALFESLDLTGKAGYAAFLAAHYIGWRAAWGEWRGFAASEAGLAVTDYPGLMAADLTELGIDTEALPRLPAPHVRAPVGLAYVLAGSRMGIAAIRRQPNWGMSHARAATYIMDESGGPVFRSLIDWMNGPEGEAVSRDDALASAKVTFALFGDALQHARKALN